jgi:Domain of unknown function (DUF4440)
MKRRLIFGVLWLALSLISAPNSFSDALADRGRLLALENAWNLAQLHHDAKAVESLIADTFVYTDYDGTVMNKAQFLADLRDPAYRASLVVNEDIKIFPYDNVAIVIGTYHTKGIYKRQPFEHYGRFTDTWIFEKSIWQCVASHTNLLKK